jgi:hypothetical protein
LAVIVGCNLMGLCCWIAVRLMGMQPLPSGLNWMGWGYGQLYSPRLGFTPVPIRTRLNDQLPCNLLIYNLTAFSPWRWRHLILLKHCCPHMRPCGPEDHCLSNTYRVFKHLAARSESLAQSSGAL